MITYTKAALRIAELWFDEEPHESGFDIVRYFQRSVALSRGSWARFPTVLINLNQTPDVLLNNMKKDTRYEIRRADSRDRVVCYFWDNVDPGLVSRFTSFYAQHSTLK